MGVRDAEERRRPAAEGRDAEGRDGGARAGGGRAGTGARRPRRRLPLRSRTWAAPAVALGLGLGALGAVLAPQAASGLAPSETRRDAARFEVWWGGLPVGELRYDLALADGRYAATATARSSGLVEVFVGARLSAEGSGAAAPQVSPERYAARVRFGDDRQTVEVAWGPGGRPREVSADPPWKPRKWQIDPAAQTGAVDPVGAAARLLTPRPPEAVCALTLDVFDGRRRSRIALGPPEARGEAGWRCEGEWRRVAGYRPRDLEKDPVALVVDYAEGADGLARLARLEVETGWGLAVARREPAED